MATNSDPLIETVGADAEYDALRQIANRLAGQLGLRQRAANHADEKQALREERAALRSRLRQIRPGTEAAASALAEWGSRLRTLET